MLAPGTRVRLDNPVSMFHGQVGEVEGYFICPATYGEAFLYIRLQRESDSIVVPCCAGELVREEDGPAP